MSRSEKQKRLNWFIKLILAKTMQDNYVSLDSLETIREEVFKVYGCTVSDVILLNCFYYEITEISPYKYENNTYHYLVSEKNLADYAATILERKINV